MIVAVVLAAGAGTRFHGPTHKLLAPWRGVPVLRRSVDAAVEAGIGPVVVVSGAVRLDGVVPAGVTVVDNPAWASGLSSSLRAGVVAAAELGADAVVVGLGDMPGVPPSAWRAVAASGAELATAAYGGRASPPVRLGRSVWTDLSASGDEGARRLLRSRPDAVVVEVDGDGVDVDVLGDLPDPQGGGEGPLPRR